MNRVSLFSFMLVMLLTINSVAQVPNGDFEQWTNGIPNGWWTNNIGVVTVEQTSDGHKGSAAKGTVVKVLSNILPPLLVSGTFGYSGFAVSERYLTLSGYYKLIPIGDDNLSVVASFNKNGTAIAVGGLQFYAASTYTYFSIPMFYLNDETPDTCIISITIADNNGPVNEGSVFYIDDLSLSTTATSVNDNRQPLTFELNQNYPNPFNPSTIITFQIPFEEMVTLNIYNSLGQNIKTLISDFRNAGNYKIAWNGKNNFGIDVPSGIYFYRLQAGNFEVSKKMILLK